MKNRIFVLKLFHDDDSLSHRAAARAAARAP